jgi:hypothetical protein
MASKLIYLSNTGYDENDITWDWCKTLDAGVNVSTTGATLTSRGEGWYVLTNANITVDTDFKIHITADSTNYATGIFEIALDIDRLQYISNIITATGTIVSEFIDDILADLGQPTNGTGFFTRNDVMKSTDYVQREISRFTENIMSTTSTIEPATSATEITIDGSRNLIRPIVAHLTYGGDTNSIFFYTEDQIRNYDAQWKTRTGSKIKGFIMNNTANGKARPYPVPDNADNDIIIDYIKLASRITAEIVEAGDAASQCSSWLLQGITSNNTAAGYVLYFEISNSSTTRTVKLYKSTTKSASYLVAQGSRTGDGSITLTERSNSGISGSVTVAYTADDTSTSNTLTFVTIEIPDSDVPCLEYGVKAMLHSLEKDERDVSKGNFWKQLYGGKDPVTGILTGELGAIRSRVRKERESTYSVLQERDDTTSIFGIIDYQVTS